MGTTNNKETGREELLRNKKVIDEINRHLWIESEKAGYDIGFEQAAVDWLEKFSKAWMNYHMPPKASKKSSSSSKKSATAKSSQSSEKKA